MHGIVFLDIDVFTNPVCDFIVFYLMRIVPFNNTLDYIASILEGLFFINVIITTPALDSLDNVLQLLLNTISVKG